MKNNASCGPGRIVRLARYAIEGAQFCRIDVSSRVRSGEEEIMKALNLMLLVFLLAGVAIAQDSMNKHGASGASDVDVIKISWSWVGHNPKLDNATFDGNPERGLRMAVNAARTNADPTQPMLSVPAPETPPPTVRPWTGWLYKFTVRNMGAKTIRKLVFEYAFTDPATQRTVGRRQYKSNVKILPGMTANLVARSVLPPIGTINATQAGQNSQDQSAGQVVIQTIKYADGSVWQRGSK
jgi:hypothetical protein